MVSAAKFKLKVSPNLGCGVDILSSRVCEKHLNEKSNASNNSEVFIVIGNKLV